MEQGLAITYGSGEGQSTTHYYAGTMDRPKKKKKMAQFIRNSKSCKK